MTTRRHFLKGGAAAAALTLASPAILRAEAVKLKVSSYLPPMHQINTELTRWIAELKEKSNGALQAELFPGSQMGPPPRQYDLVRTGVADVGFIYTAFTPGRFMISDLLSLPFLLADDHSRPMPAAGASWLASSMRDALAPEFVGTQLLYSVTSTALGFFMRDKMITVPDDLKGLRIRPTNAVSAEHLTAMGASPATISPTEVADAISKGVIDGAIFNFEGGKAFGLQQSVKKVSTIASTAGVFALVVNDGVMQGLSPALQEVIVSTTGPEAGRASGQLYDDAEAAGRSFMEGEGVEVLDLWDDLAQPFREALKPVGDAQIAAARAKGIDVDAVLDRIEALKAQA